MIPLSVLVRAIREVPTPPLGGELAGEPQQFEVCYTGRWLRLVVPVLQMLMVGKRVAEVVLVIHRPAGRILLAERSYPRLFALPTGGVEPGESVAAAARREAAEETGLLVQLLGCPAVVVHNFGGLALFRSYVVRLCDLGGGQEPCGDEATVFRDATLDELAAVATQWYQAKVPGLGTLYGRFRAGPLRVAYETLKVGGSMMSGSRIPIRGDVDIVAARTSSRDLARALGFGVLDQARVVTAVVELARNVVQYAEVGAVTLRRIGDNGRVGLEVICEDQGPGIPDVALALRDGYSTSGGLGMGLPGVRRVMDEFEIESAPGAGTKVTARKWLGN